MGMDLGHRVYESSPYIPKVGEQLSLSYGPDQFQSAIFTVVKVVPNLDKKDVDRFDVWVSLD